LVRIVASSYHSHAVYLPYITGIDGVLVGLASLVQIRGARLEGMDTSICGDPGCNENDGNSYKISGK
jgi:hypothetical protein